MKTLCVLKPYTIIQRQLLNDIQCKLIITIHVTFLKEKYTQQRRIIDILRYMCEVTESLILQ